MLASQSPQRRQILADLGVDFVVDPAGVEEIVDGDPAEVALENARLKAREVVGRGVDPGRVVLAADTVVALDGRILDKPAGPREAAASIAKLAGREHLVHGGMVIAGPGDEWREATSVSAVTFRPLSPEEVDAYVASGEWEGRAGGYAIQLTGRSLVESVDGEEANVIGLSVRALRGLVQGLVPAGGRSGDRYNP